MKVFFVILMLFFIACGQPNERLENFSANKGQANQAIISNEKEINDAPPAFNEDIYKEYIPQNLAEFLAKEMPEWKIPAPNNWDKFWFNEYKTSDKLVNFVSGDFNCDRQTDYALILEDKQNELAAWVLFSKKNSFEKIKLEDFGGGAEQIEIGLGILEPGIIENDWTPKPVKINCQAIEVISFEKAAEAYYWESGKFKSIITGD